jgi:hypothetical protein
MAVRLKLTIVVGAVSLFALMQVLSASASAVAQAPTQSVIVVFKNQDRAQPATRSALGARRRTLAAVQAPVLRQLSAVTREMCTATPRSTRCRRACHRRRSRR